LDTGFTKALVKKILLASGDRPPSQGARRLSLILSIRLGVVQPWLVFSVMKTPLRRLKQKVLPSAENVPLASHGCFSVLQIRPGAKTLAVEPGGVCPRYGPSAKGFANNGLEHTAKKATSQTIVFFVCFITNLLFTRLIGLQAVYEIRVDIP
jgi:hypothetical protein